VRQFEPDKVVVGSEKWAFENDRSTGDESPHQPGDAAGRDGGVPLHITPPADGNVISSVTLHYAMPANGSPQPHQVVTDADPAAVTVTQTIAGNVVTVTIEANDPYGSIGNLTFIPGDNYDNADVNITIAQIHVADPLLHTTTKDDPDWGSGVAEGHETVTVRVDAVAQAPALGGFTVDHNSDDPVLAGGVLHISGEVSFEDTADGSEDHFLLLEIQDGYYPDAVTLMFEGRTVTLPVTHYSSDGPANYSLQQLVTADDGRPHMFMKLPVDGCLAELMGGATLERMDGIRLDVAYQTREWAAEGTALHFAAISTEDVEAVRQYDADWNIVNDEQPFDRQLEKHVPGLVVMENNTAIAVAAQGAYVYWDALDSDEVNFRGFVFENDRPADHQRVAAYVLHRPAADKVQSYPVHQALLPEDAESGRDFGTGWQLTVPEHVYSFTLTESAANQGRGDFYYLPATVWAGHMASGADADVALSAYRVVMGETTEGRQGFVLVFIPSNEAYTGAHQENAPEGIAAHTDTDYRFSYEIVTSQYSPGGTLVGYKRYLGEDKVIRIDAVANQAALLSAETNVPSRHFSLWNVKDSVSSFELTVDFHDVDATEDHYVLVEMVPNFAFRCGSYYYRPHGGGNVTETDSNAIYTHIFTDANGNQQFIRYYKIPVSNAAIDPATGEVTVRVEFQRLPGMPQTADYPSSDMLTYGAMTVDKTASRWDSTDPTSPSFVNRKGADGEYSYDNNTSVIIRNGIGDGAEDTGLNPGWTPPGTGAGLPNIVIGNPHGTGEPVIITPDDPRYNPNVVLPGPNHAAAEIIKPWLVVPGWAPTHDPGSPADPWGIPDPDSPSIPWTPPEAGGTPGPLPDPDDPARPNPWIASRGQG
ncbi:MAG: hypothetical protein K2J64_05060, partial [Desulfovibrio sp.]|nr:hypothetical protein [Desulfovibrio sp.]